MARVFGPLSASGADAHRARHVPHVLGRDGGVRPLARRRAPQPEIDGPAASRGGARRRARGRSSGRARYFGRRNIAKQALHRRGISPPSSPRRRCTAPDSRGDSALRMAPRPGRAAVFRRPRDASSSRRRRVAALAASLAFTRRLLAILQRNEIVCVTADVAHGERLLTLPLLGEPKRFPTGMVSLARTSGAPLLPLFCTREPDGRLQVIIEPAIPSRRPTTARPIRGAAPRVRRPPRTLHPALSGPVSQLALPVVER